MGIIDSHSEYSLYDAVNGDLPTPTVEENEVIEYGSVEYMGMHIAPLDEDTYRVQLDGHAGKVMTFEPSEYDDVLELVDDLNGIVVRWNEYDYQDNKADLVDWAGKIMTSRPERAEENPDLYLHVPEP